MKHKIILLLALIAFTTTGCRVTFVPEYSATLEQQIENGAKLNDKLYIDLSDAENSKRAYPGFAERYSEIESVINAIRLKNEIRKNNTDMLVIIDKLKTNFSKYRKEHKEKAEPLSNGEILGYQAYIKAFWKPLLIAEGGLKKAKSVKN